MRHRFVTVGVLATQLCCNGLFAQLCLTRSVRWIGRIRTWHLGAARHILFVTGDVSRLWLMPPHVAGLLQELDALLRPPHGPGFDRRPGRGQARVFVTGRPLHHAGRYITPAVTYSR